MSLLHLLLLLLLLLRCSKSLMRSPSFLLLSFVLLLPATAPQKAECVLFQLSSKHLLLLLLSLSAHL